MAFWWFLFSQIQGMALDSIPGGFPYFLCRRSYRSNEDFADCRCQQPFFAANPQGMRLSELSPEPSHAGSQPPAKSAEECNELTGYSVCQSNCTDPVARGLFTCELFSFSLVQ